MPPELAQGIYRVVGHLVEGWLTVELVRSLTEWPEVKPPPGGTVISIHDDLWIDRVPVSLVEIGDRFPNTLLKVTVRNRTEVIHVERANAA
jgi:hypothetical protein